MLATEKNVSVRVSQGRFFGMIDSGVLCFQLTKQKSNIWVQKMKIYKWVSCLDLIGKNGV